MTRSEEKRICDEIASAASELAQPGLNHAQKYMGRLRLVTAIETLYAAAGLKLPYHLRPRDRGIEACVSTSTRGHNDQPAMGVSHDAP